MPYGKNKRFIAFLLSTLMTLGLGTSSKKDLLDKDIVPSSIELDYFKNIDAKIIDLDYESLDGNLDLEDIVYLGFCSELLHEYQQRMYLREIDLRLCTDVDDLTKGQLQFLDKYYDSIDYYLSIISKLGKLFDKHYGMLASYIDSNKSFSFENEDTLISKTNCNLPSYGLGDMILTKHVLLDYNWVGIDVDYKDFKPYRKYNFIDEDVSIRLKENEKNNNNNLPDEYALLPNNVVICENLDCRKYGMNQYPLKKVSKSKRKKTFKLNYVDNNIVNQYKNPMITNYPLGAAKKRSGYRGK